MHMEVKYSKGSKTLADLKNQFEKEYEQEVANRARNEEARMKKEGLIKIQGDCFALAEGSLKNVPNGTW